MKQQQKDEIMKRAIKTAEKNIISGNWVLKTAQTYLQGAYDWPEMYKKHQTKAVKI